METEHSKINGLTPAAVLTTSSVDVETPLNIFETFLKKENASILPTPLLLQKLVE